MNSDPTSQNSRNTRLDVRGLLRIVLGAILVLFTPAWLAVAAYEYSQPTASATSLVSPVVEIRDETSSFQSIDGRPLSVALEGIGFLRPIHLVVLSTDNLTDDNLDEATLKYARAKHPEWIARNGYKWADGYFILAVSPTHRQVGTYFGEDIAPTLSIQSEIQDAAKDDFREGRWSQGVVAAVSTAASIMPNEAGMSLENRPVWPDWKGALATLVESAFSRVGTACTVRRSRTQARWPRSGRLWRGAGARWSARSSLSSKPGTTRAVCPRATNLRAPNTRGFGSGLRRRNQRISWER